MITSILSKLKNIAIEDPVVFGKISTRFHTTKVNLADNLEFPAIVTVALPGDYEDWSEKSATIPIDIFFISDSYVDEAFNLYEAFRDILLTENKYSVDGVRFVIKPSSTPTDISGRYGDKSLYIAQMSYKVMAINV